MEVKRTIVSVLNLESGEGLDANILFSSESEESESANFKLRTEIEVDIKTNRVKYVCLFCKQPVVIRGTPNGNTGKKTLYFSHLKDSNDCHIKTKSNLTTDEINRIKYNGQKESNRHIFLKEAIAGYLEADESFSEVKVEKIIKASAISKAWRKPDIQGKFQDISIAFELQLSTTFLTEIIGRTIFYSNIDVYLMWIFSDFSLDRDVQKFMQKDIFYNNSFNVFVFNEEAMFKSELERKLKLLCYYKWFSIEKGEIQGEWKSEFVSISDLYFNKESRTVTYFDSDKQKSELQKELLKAIEKEKELAEKRKSEERVTEAVEYVRNYFKLNKDPMEGWMSNPFDALYSDNDLTAVNEKLGFSDKHADFIVKTIFKSNKYAFLNFLMKCEKIKINLSNVVKDRVSVFQYILHIEDDYEFSKSMYWLFKFRYKLSNEDLKSLENAYEKNYANVTEYERRAISRWALISYLKHTTSWEDVIRVEKRIIQLNRIMSLKHNLIIDAGFANMKGLAMNVLNSYRQYSKIFIHAMKVYNIYDDLMKTDKKGSFVSVLSGIERREDEQDISYDDLFYKIFPELEPDDYISMYNPESIVSGVKII